MLHLAADRLAALVDDEPTAEELEHLRLCAACAAELEAHRRLRALASSERQRIAPPATSWATLGPALRAAGVMHDGGAGRSVGPARRWGARAAAAAVLLMGGTMLGRVSAGATLVPLSHRGGATADTAPVYRSSTEAIAAMNDAERRYQLASAFLAARDTSGSFGADSSDVYRTRLAALDNVVAASREALYEAPHDPVINRYYLTSLGAREATIQRLGMALPVGMQISRY